MKTNPLRASTAYMEQIEWVFAIKVHNLLFQTQCLCELVPGQKPRLSFSFICRDFVWKKKSSQLRVLKPLPLGFVFLLFASDASSVGSFAQPRVTHIGIEEQEKVFKAQRGSKEALLVSSGVFLYCHKSHISELFCFHTLCISLIPHSWKLENS